MAKNIDPTKLTRDQRLQELATILARGIKRLRDLQSSQQNSLPNQARNLQKEP